MILDGDIARSLHALRQERGLSLGEVAHRAGVSVNSILGWESGRQVPRGRSLVRMLEALGAPERTRARLLALADPQYARIALAKTPLGPPLGVGTVIRAMRARRGVTQSELARTLGVTQGAVAKWESGDSTPSPTSLHEVAFALGASAEETVALSSAQGESPDDLPSEPNGIGQLQNAPVELQEAVSLGYEAELWRRATHDARWESLMIGVLAYRANLYVLERRFAEVASVAERSVRLATTPEGRAAAVPAVNALNELSLLRGGSHADAARVCGTWAARLPDSAFKAWMLGAQGMYLARAGRVREGIDLVVRARDMDDELEVYGPQGEDRPGHGRAQSLAYAYMAAGTREAAEAARRELAPFRCPSSDQVLYAQVEHANGSALDEASLDYLRHAVLGTPSNLSAKNLTSLEEIERTQARLTGESPAPVSSLETRADETEARRLWAAVPNGLP